MPANSPTVDDRELILLYKKTEDLEVLGLLFGRYTSLIYGVCLKYLKDREDAKDSVMQVFEKLIQTVKAHEIENFKGWVYVTARNQCLMQLRADKGKFAGEISQELMENALLLHPEDEPALEQNLSKLEKCIDELAIDQKRCIQLFFLQEKCYKDITGLTGFDIGKVKSYIQNGKRNLKICMDRSG